MNDINILVTGAGGFIGNNISRYLLQNTKHKIYAADIKFDERSDDLLDYMNYRRYDIDLTNTDDFFVIYDNIKKIDIILHLASPIGVNNVTNNPSDTFVNGTLINNNVLLLAHKYNSKIIFTSSSEVYGEGKIYSTEEYLKIPSANTEIFGRGSYALQKLNFEYQLKLSGIDSTILRLFNVVGKDQNTPGMIIPTMINDAITKGSITIINNGTRSYCSVKEAIKQFYEVINDIIEEKFNDNFRIFNIGNPNNSNIKSALDIAEIVFKELKLPVDIHYENTNNEFNITARILRDHNKYNNNCEINVENIIKESIDFSLATNKLK